MAMSMEREQNWRDFCAKEAPYWVDEPRALIGTMKAIMADCETSAGDRLKKMQWAMAAYHQALRERE